MIKLNSEKNPHHFVIPVDEKIDISKTKIECQFDVEKVAFDANTFSIIVREGNIPIHFETLSGNKLARKGETLSKNSMQIRLQNVQPDNKEIVLIYQLQ